jgi:hypothetical protein
MCAQFFRGFVTFCFLSIKKLPYQISPIQQFPHLLIYQLCKNTCTSFTAQWQCPPQLPQLPLQPFPLFLSFTILLTARPAITTTIAPTTTVPILQDTSLSDPDNFYFVAFTPTLRVVLSLYGLTSR